MLEKEGIAVAGCPAKEGKIAFRDWEFYEKAGKLADVILSGGRWFQTASGESAWTKRTGDP